MGYYGYQKREDSGFVDIGGKITEFGQKYQKERLDRQKRRDVIDADTQKSMSEMAEFQASDFDSTNDIALKAVNEARNVAAESEVMFKNGQMSESQFALIKQSAKDDMSNLKGIISGINTQLTEKSDGTAGNQLIIKGLTENLDALKGGIKFGKDGRGYIEIDGKKVPLRQMQQKMGQKWSNVDLGPVLDDTEDLGVYKRDWETYGSEDSALFNTSFPGWLESTIDSFVSDDDLQKTSSILTENAKYKLTRNPDEVDDMTILVDENNQPQLSDKQKQVARDIVEDQIKVRIGMNRDSNALKRDELRLKQRKQTQDEKTAKGKENKLINVYQKAVNVFESTGADRDAAIQTIIADSKDINSAEKTLIPGTKDYQIVVKYNDEKRPERTIRISGTDKRKAVDAILSLSDMPLEDRAEAERLYGKKIGDIGQEKTRETIAGGEQGLKDFDRDTNLNLWTDTTGKKALKDVLSQLSDLNPDIEYLQGLKGNVNNEWLSADKVEIKDKNGKVVFSEDTDEVKEMSWNELAEKIRKNTPGKKKLPGQK